MANNYYDKRDEIINSWFINGEKALKENNIFEAFIYLWIAWVVACKKNNDLNYGDRLKENPDNTDRQEIILFCNSFYLDINKILGKHTTALNNLATRKGSRFNNPIIDASTQLRKMFLYLSKDILGKIKLKENERVEYVAELLNKIRNNLFHGDKIYDNKEDKELIQNSVEILYDLTRLSLSYLENKA